MLQMLEVSESLLWIIFCSHGPQDISTVTLAFHKVCPWFSHFLKVLYFDFSQRPLHRQQVSECSGASGLPSCFGWAASWRARSCCPAVCVPSDDPATVSSVILFDILSFLNLTFTGHEFHSLMMCMWSVWQVLCLFSSIPFIIPVFAV